MYQNKRMRISKLIKRLEKAKEKEGDLFVYYASGYDWACPIWDVELEALDDEPWDGAPKERALYLC